jgi:hypothetical protein
MGRKKLEMQNKKLISFYALQTVSQNAFCLQQSLKVFPEYTWQEMFVSSA